MLGMIAASCHRMLCKIKIMFAVNMLDRLDTLGTMIACGHGLLCHFDMLSMVAACCYESCHCSVLSMVAA